MVTNLTHFDMMGYRFNRDKMCFSFMFKCFAQV